MPKTGEKVRKVMTLLIVWALLLTFFLAYERYFVSSQEAFLKEMRFQAVVRLARELDAQIQRAQISTASFVQLAAGENPLEDQKLEEFSRMYFKDAWNGNHDPKLREQSIQIARKCLVKDGSVALKSEPKGLALSFSCIRSEALASSGTFPPLYTLALFPWIEKAFVPLGSDFDDVLIADATTGEILFQKSSDGPRVANLRSLLLDDAIDPKQKSPKSELKDIKAGDVTESSAKRAQADDKGLQKFTDRSFFTPSTLGGLDYKLFSVPARIQLNGLPAGTSWNLAVVGLQRSERFEAQSHAIPYSTMIWVTLIAAALFSLSWPVVKLRYMSNTERFTQKEGWLLILTIFLAATSVTLMLLNATYTARSQSQVDRNLAALAHRIKANFACEMTLASIQLEELNPREPDHQKIDKISDYLGRGKQPLRRYPYFDMAFWVKRDGWQFHKFDLRPAPTPVVYVGDLPFFSNALPDPKGSIEKSANLGEKSSTATDLQQSNSVDRTYYLDPEISLTTNEFAPVLAAHYIHNSDADASVEAMVVRPMSVVDPVLPPGYGFAVIGASCQVLFHSDSFRNLKENFCQESKGSAELKPWLFGAAESPIDISYSGQPERAFITPMDFTEMKVDGPELQPAILRFAGGPAYLIVFRTSDYALTLNLAIMVVCSMLFGCYFIVLLIFIGVDISLRGPLHVITAPENMWPCRENGLRYVQIFAGNSALFVLYWLLFPHLYEAPLLGLTLLVAAFSVLLSSLKLSSRAKLSRLGMLLLAASLMGLPVIILHAPSGEGISWSEWWRSWNDWGMVLIFVGIAGTVALAVSRPDGLGGPLASRFPRLSGWIGRAARDRFATAYSLAALTVITGVSIVPCMGFFKCAYDMVSEMALKHDEIALSRILVARDARIHRYYRDLIPLEAYADKESNKEDRVAQEKIWQTAKSRLDRKLDRYDITINKDFGFKYTNESSLDCRSQDSGVNEKLERAIAGMVLYFPANDLGAEMSKLGVAATTGVNADYCFGEPAPNVFRMSSEPISNPHPNSYVEASYLKWSGFLWWGDALMLLLWIVLSLWLTSLLRKIFLTDVRSHREAADVGWEKKSDIKGNYLVIGLAECSKSKTLQSIRDMSPEDYFDLRVGLRPLTPYPNPSSKETVVIVDHFEFDLNNRDANLTKLNLLEHLLYETDCKILLVSSVDPLYYLTEEAPNVLVDPGNPALLRQLLDRWARVLSNFQKMHLCNAGDRTFTDKLEKFISDHEDQRQFALLVRMECNRTARLRHIGVSILEDFDKSVPFTEEMIVDLVLDRAVEYYRVLWSGLAASERLVLYQLALDGWANPKNTEALQQLESKLLIKRMPMFRIMNMSFQRFIAFAEHTSEIEQWEKQQRQSTWRAFRVVMIGLFLMLVVWLLHSQAALSQEVAAYIAGITTLLTAISTLFSRSGKQIPDNQEQH